MARARRAGPSIEGSFTDYFLLISTCFNAVQSGK